MKPVHGLTHCTTIKIAKIKAKVECRKKKDAVVTFDTFLIIKRSGTRVCRVRRLSEKCEPND
jgi:hypothetical protein